MNKSDALKRLSAIEEETKQLRKIIDTPEKDWKSVTDFFDACEYLKENGFVNCSASSLINMWSNAGLSTQQISCLKLEICIKAINTENGVTWKPNWLDKNQRKHYCWMERQSRGWVVYYGYFCCTVGGYLGSGMYFQSEEKSKHGAQYFKKYYEQMMEDCPLE